MIRFLVDANVVLDVLLERQPFFAVSRQIWKAAENGLVAGYIPAHAVTTIDYLICKDLGRSRGNEILNNVLKVFRVASVDDVVVRTALDWAWDDFEDAVAAAAAQKTKCDLIVTRDAGGFRKSPVRAVTPEAAASLIHL